VSALRVIEFGPIMRAFDAAVKDKSYQRSPVGREVGRYLRELRFTGASDNTRDSYETTLARLSLDHDDFDSVERFAAPDGPELLFAFLERHWADAAPATKANRVAAVRGFFAWELEKGRIAWNPAARLKAPRGARSTERLAHAPAELEQLIGAQRRLRDRCALGIFCKLGLRKNELRLLRVGEIDLVRNLISISHGKGGTVAVLPIGFASLRADLYLHLIGEERKPEEYLLYPKHDVRRPMSRSSLHRWFKRCLAAAGLRDFPLHELRHSAGDALWRATGNIVLAQQLLRHKSVGTTQLYLHPTREDLIIGMKLLEDALDQGN
jgi:integrase